MALHAGKGTGLRLCRAIKHKVRSLEVSWFEINLAEAWRMNYRGRGTEVRPTERASMSSDFYQSPTAPCHLPKISLNHIYPFLLRRDAPSELIWPICLWKAPQRPWLQQPQVTISTFVLSCLFVAKTAAQREFDFLSLLLKSHSATSANLFFCPIALVADNIKLSRRRRCQTSLRARRSSLTRDTAIATTRPE